MCLSACRLELFSILWDSPKGEMGKKAAVEKNLWEVKPKRNAEWETVDSEKVVVLVPKFKNPFLVRWVLPHLSKPYFRINLDAMGSFIWQRCDGNTSVSDIAEGLQQKFGNSKQPLEQRISSFLQHLERGDLITTEH